MSDDKLSRAEIDAFADKVSERVMPSIAAAIVNARRSALEEAAKVCEQWATERRGINVTEAEKALLLGALATELRRLAERGGR